MVTMIVTDQKISEMTPKMLACDTVTGCGSLGLNTVWTVYSGLVPMSPKTTPRAPTARANWAVVRVLELTAFLSPARTLPTRAMEHHTVQAVARTLLGRGYCCSAVRGAEPTSAAGQEAGNVRRW